MQTPPEPSSSFTTTIISIAAGAGLTGLAALLKVWLENKRLEKKDYRRSLLDRIKMLEAQNDRCRVEQDIQREEIRVLNEKCALLKELLDVRHPKNRG